MLNFKNISDTGRWKRDFKEDQEGETGRKCREEAYHLLLLMSYLNGMLKDFSSGKIIKETLNNC